MSPTPRYLPTGCFAPAALILPWQLVSARDDPASDKNITVLTQGPIHEAYAQPVDKNPPPTPVVPNEPPDPIPEEPPAQILWIPHGGPTRL